MTTPMNLDDKIKRGAEDSGRYFHFMAEFVGFTDADVEAIRESHLVIEKHIPEIVAQFYTQLLTYPPTRKFFLRKDGTLDQDYLQMRMAHLANFWRRTAMGIFDDDYARYVDYVGRAHTEHGADPNIYIPERYVIGQVGFIQHAITQALSKELHDIDPDWEIRALRAWNLLMMVILEMLSRAYGNEREPEEYNARALVDHGPVKQLAVEAYELSLGMRTTQEKRDIVVADESEIPDGERKIVEIDDLSIGVFHHKGGWYALKNSCLHRSGPVCEGMLEGDELVCPWHGYRYNVTDGTLLSDTSANLDMYQVELKDGQVHLKIPEVMRDEIEITIVEAKEKEETEITLQDNEFRTADLPPGNIALVYVDDEPVAVYNVDGVFYATSDYCTHADGPMSDGELDGKNAICPWHDSCFDVTTGEVVRGPAKEPLKTYKVEVDDEIGRVME